VEKNNGQCFVYNETQPYFGAVDEFSNALSQTRQEELSDPAKAQILARTIVAIEEEDLLSMQPGLTISDVCDLTGYKDGFVRLKLGELVREGKLGCVPGRGRRPSYYVLPGALEQFQDWQIADKQDYLVYPSSQDLDREDMRRATDLILAQIRERKQELEQIINETSVLLKDLEATERVLSEVSKEYSQKINRTE
jgi:hypothetical protein